MNGARAGLLAMCLAVLAQGCSTSNPVHAPRADVVVASFNFPESVLLAQIYAGALRASGLRVQVEDNAGPREVVDPALSRGLVDLVPEYAGSALAFFSLGLVRPDARIDVTLAALARALAPKGLDAMTPAAAQNANAIVVTKQTATKYGLRAITDLGSVAGILTFGGPPECPQRPLCLAGLERVYGLRFNTFVPLDTGGPLTRDALMSGEIDVALLFTTDPALTSGDLVVLRDDRSLQPAENVTPVVRQTLIGAHGGALRTALDAVSARLSTSVVRDLDARVARGAAPAAVAREWLESEGLGR